MSTIRSLEEIIKQKKEKKAKEGAQQNFYATVGMVINAEPGSTIHIDQSKKD